MVNPTCLLETTRLLGILEYARTILYDFFLIVEHLWSLESMIQEIPQPKCLLFDYHTFIFHMDVVFNRLQVDYNEEFYISVALMQALLDISQTNDNIWAAENATVALAKITELQNHQKLCFQSIQDARLAYGFFGLPDDCTFNDKIIATYNDLVWFEGKDVALVATEQVLKNTAQEQGIEIFNVEELGDAQPPME